MILCFPYCDSHQAYSLQATIRKQDADEIRSRITEGSIYIIEKFNVVPNKKKYAAVDRRYMVQINKWTSLTLLEEGNEQLPLYSFNFIKFSDLQKERYNDTVLTGIIYLIIICLFYTKLY